MSHKKHSTPKAPTNPTLALADVEFGQSDDHPRADRFPVDFSFISLAQGQQARGNTRRVSAENERNNIFILLLSQTGHDFSRYKPSAIFRHINRRMAVHQIASLKNYVKYLQRTPEEVEALFRDLLIGVTRFFRDTEAFQVLEDKAIPKIFEGKPAGASIRVWCPGCSTGDEPYSIAILLLEHMENLKKNYAIQIFATDIDSQAISTARAGSYPDSIAADISPERLARYFTEEADGTGYRINESIRDLVIFSEQDVIKDPPFSKLDLISCRNLLIYMSTFLQKKLIPLFHYSLNPDGVLFLGNSEGVGEFEDLFGVIDRKSRVFKRSKASEHARHLGQNRFLASHMATAVAVTPGETSSNNEEIATVNAELQTKVTGLGRVNNDMNNLLARSPSFPPLWPATAEKCTPYRPLNG